MIAVHGSEGYLSKSGLWASNIRRVSSKGRIHVLPRKDKWIVRKDGIERASGVYDNKQLAMIEAKKVMLASQATYLFMHDATEKVISAITNEF